jgi:hypothetical protein
LGKSHLTLVLANTGFLSANEPSQIAFPEVALMKRGHLWEWFAREQGVSAQGLLGFSIPKTGWSARVSLVICLRRLDFWQNRIKNRADTYPPGFTVLCFLFSAH